MMHQEFFYVAPDLVDRQSLRICGEEFKHLVSVMRKNVGDSATATDGQGNTFLFQISKIGENYADAAIVKRCRLQGEPNFQLTLAQAILKGRRLEQVIEKGTEIGITRFIPMLTERTIVDKNEQKARRWQRIALAAMKQSCRSVLPEIAPICKYESIISENSKFPIKLLAHNAVNTRLLSQIFAEYLSANNNVHINSGIIMVGPEGGFSQAEVELAQQNGFQLFSMGPRRLRAETAGIVGSALVLDKFGEL